MSITLKATLHGHEVMVTLRGVDFASVKAQVEQASEWLKVQAPAQPPTQGTEHPDGLVQQARRADDAEPQGRPLLVVPQDR